jgi:hypothetical protein
MVPADLLNEWHHYTWAFNGLDFTMFQDGKIIHQRVGEFNNVVYNIAVNGFLMGQD